MNNIDKDCDYIFQSSTVALKVLLRSDRRSMSNCLQSECLYMDGSFSHLSNFVTLNLWIYHSPLRKLLRVASMVTKRENTKTVAKFWTLINEGIENLTKIQNYKYDGCFIVCDFAGANINGIGQVFGEEYAKNRVFSCQFHFLEKVNKKKHFVAENDQALFVTLAKEMCYAPMIDTYKTAKEKMLTLLSRNAEKVSRFVNWYICREEFLFGCFRPKLSNIAASNLSEIGNSSIKARSKQPLIVTVEQDVRYFQMQDEAVKSFDLNIIGSFGERANTRPEIRKREI